MKKLMTVVAIMAVFGFAAAQADIFWNFGGGGVGNTNGWSEVAGGGFVSTLRNDQGDEGYGAAIVSGGSFAADSAHPVFTWESPEFHFDGSALTTWNQPTMLNNENGAGAVDNENLAADDVFQVETLNPGGDGGGDPGQNGWAFNGSTPAAFIAGGMQSSPNGDKGIAFLNVGTGLYDAVVFTRNGEMSYGASAAELAAVGLVTFGNDASIHVGTGIAINTTYRLHFVESRQGGSGHTQLNDINIAGVLGPAGGGPGGEVPEPAGLGLVGLALLGLRKRRS